MSASGRRDRTGRGSLTIVGTGFCAAGQTTLEAVSHLEAAEQVFYAVGDPISSLWIEGINPASESLVDAYAQGKSRDDTYREMVERMLVPVRLGRRVCAAFYGHPGVFVEPSHAAIQQARREGFTARMLPGISAEDCLFADLGVDPASAGCQSFEATDFLLRPRQLDDTCALILWQIGAIGVEDFRRQDLWSREGLAILTEFLLERYADHHEVVIYEAAATPICDPVIRRLPLTELAQAPVTVSSTLYVPPVGPAPTDRRMAERLSLV